MKKTIIQTYIAAITTVSVLYLAGCGAPGSGGHNGPDSTHTNAVSNVSTLPSNAIANALPFTIEFKQKDYGSASPLPYLQSYQIAVTRQGYWLVVGGRRQGLHTFNQAPATNFVKDSANNFIYVINPANGQYWSYDVKKLPDNLSAALQATNAQSCHDKKSDNFYLIGGYGWKADGSDMVTFNTIIRFKVEDLAQAVIAGTDPASLFSVDNDKRFAVTGGELYLLNNQFYLIFGQLFNGQYRPFGGGDFTQNYVENYAVFKLRPNSLKILSYGSTSCTLPDHPFHRRDGNIIEDIDPKTGQNRISAFGGVFKPGIIAPYTYPIYIYSASNYVIDTTFQQKFSQYTCPVINVFDSGTNSAIYHTFFGGIGHYYYSQTDSQKAVYDIATKQGRNDGFPFVADISTFVQTAAGTYTEYILPQHIANNRLLGSTLRFIVNPDIIAQGMAYDNGVVKLSNIPKGNKVLIGYIYGGIEAKNPLPLVPSTGTFVSNTVFEVYLTNTPMTALPASDGHEAVSHAENISRK